MFFGSLLFVKITPGKNVRKAKPYVYKQFRFLSLIIYRLRRNKRNKPWFRFRLMVDKKTTISLFVKRKYALNEEAVFSQEEHLTFVIV